ncbi:hypothetical protein CFE70_006734 [Pyrenophora teres f. teres 0-1]
MSNQAAWIPEAKGKLQVKEAPMPKADKGEVVIKNHAVAVNPVDWKIQDYGLFLQKYPYICGTDVAGEVHEVGEGVTHVKPGDRVLGGIGPPSRNLNRFRLPLQEGDTRPAPTVLQPPSTNKSVLVWGGSSSVGAVAIQLAVGAGVKVVSVASKHNVEKLKGLGATAAFDYKDPNVTQDIIAALEGTEFAGVCDAIATPEAVAAWTPVYEKLGGRYGSVLPTDKGMPEGIQGSSVFAVSVALADKYIGDVVWAQWVPEALEKGTLKPVPEPLVVGKGLEAVQKGYDEQKKGVSFRKVVVEL